MRRLIIILFLCLATGCGGTHRSQKKTGASPPAAAPPLPAIGAFYTSGLDDFGSATHLPRSPLERRLLKSLRRTLSPPASLDCLAREYAARFGADGKDPSPLTTHALAQHCGYWTQPAQPYSVTAPSIDAIEAHLRTLPGDSTQGAFGLGVVRHPDGKFTVSLLIPPRDLSIQALPRAGTARLTGRLESGDGDVEFWVQDAQDGPARRLKAEITTTGGFTLELPDPVGGHRVEIARVLGGFRQTIALMRRGSTRPQSYAAPAPNVGRVDTSVIGQAINAYRVSKGLSALRVEAHLSGPLNDWLQRASKQARSNPPPGILDLRGWRYARMDYGFTYGRTPMEAVTLLADTPTGYALLNAVQYDRIAIGLLPFKRSVGFDVVLVNLARFEFNGPDRARASLLDRMNSARRDAGLKALSAEPALEALAQRTVEATMSGRLAWSKALKALKATVVRDKLAGGVFGSGGNTVVSLSEIAVGQDPVVMTPAIRWVGIGVAGGPLPGGGEPRYIVIYVGAEKPGKPPK